MRWKRSYTLAVAVAVLAGAALTAAYYRDAWWKWIIAESSKATDEESAQAPADQVVLSPRARENLGLPEQVERLYTTTHVRKVQLPGEIEDRPGYSDRGVVSPVTGTVLQCHALPGDIVTPGQKLFTLRLLSELVATTRSELYKARRDYDITLDRIKRLTDPKLGAEAVEGSRVVDLNNQLRRLDASINAYRQELQQRGLTKEQIDATEKGPPFDDTIEILAPPPVAQASHPGEGETEAVSFIPGKNQSPAFEVEDLKVELGRQVQAGQTLCTLADHHWLYIEGYGFRQEIPLVARAAKEGWKVEVEFLEESNDGWEKPLETAFQIRHLSNNIDPETRTFSFYLPLHNQSETYEKNRRKLLRWRFRPGQRVRLNVPVKEFEEVIENGKTVLKEKNVFVVPSAAVARDGPEAYVFEQGEAGVVLPSPKARKDLGLPDETERLNTETYERKVDGKVVATKEKVLVLPSAAVVREGLEAFVFEQKGEAYKRWSVRVLDEDPEQLVIDKDSLKGDGNVTGTGRRIARRGALELNRALKSQDKPLPGYHVLANDYKRHAVRVLYEDRNEIVIDKNSLEEGLRVVPRGALQINRVLKSQAGKSVGFHIHADGSIHFNEPGDE